MKLGKKILALGLSIAILGGTVITSEAYDKPNISRIQGKDNYETAALIADKQTYSTAILVNLDNSISDGLSSSGLSGAVNAPILLTKKDSIPDTTLTRLTKAKKIYIIGGVNSVSSKVENNLKSKGITVVRIQGKDRIQTSLNVANEIKKYADPKETFFANGFKGEADAISISSVAVLAKSPIVLTDGKSTSYNYNNTSYVIGGKDSMSDSFAKSTDSYRLGGKDRYDTNKKIIQFFYREPLGEDSEKTGLTFHVADGNNLTSGIVASPISKYAPLVLVSENSNKSILLGAQNIIAVGEMSAKTIEGCLDPYPVIGDMLGVWYREDVEGMLFNIQIDQVGYIYRDKEDDPTNWSDYDVVSYDRANNSVILRLHSDKFAPLMRVTVLNNGKLKQEYYNGNKYVLIGYYNSYSWQ